jgi:GNAT superfamily N-acetyltransferase
VSASVRQVTEDDHEPLAGVLARAFHDDPVNAWFFRRERVRDRWAARFFGWELRRLARQDLTHTTSDRAGAAVWALPHRWRERPVDAARLVAGVLPGIGLLHARHCLRAIGRVEERHPTEPHLYLAVLGVEPSRQGNGVGSALLAPGLALCDTEGLPAYLETATERNVGFYARHGFRVTGEVHLPGGPDMWLMWRDPR